MAILVTGSAGFIGFHTARELLKLGEQVIGLDNHNNYYDVSLKDARASILKTYANYKHFKVDIENEDAIQEIFKSYPFDYVIHLAAQAGVRYSIENPYEYIKSNVTGFLN